MMYRASPHSITKKSPAELMFNRNIRDKLPSMDQPIAIDEELSDRDREKKMKGKEYGDEKRHAKLNDVKEGDDVLLKRQVIPNKIATTFEPTVFKVMERKGSEVIVENTESGSTYRRNVAHTKKIGEHGTVRLTIRNRTNHDIIANISLLTFIPFQNPNEQPSPETTDMTTDEPSTGRPQRKRRAPARYDPSTKRQRS